MYNYIVIIHDSIGGINMSKSKKKDPKIKCNVDSCQHNNCEEGICDLETISVSCTCNNDECCDCKETVCESFETTGGDITDTVYEVQAETEIEEEEA